MRKRRLDLYPLCAECLKEGKTTTTDQIDHIVPIDQDGPDTDENCQGLCHAHHKAKTASEGHYTAYPLWLKQSAIPLTIVCGAPASGKTTYVHKNAEPCDTIIDLDDIVEAQTGQRRHNGIAHLAPAIRERNTQLASLSVATVGRAWFIVTAGHSEQRRWWREQLGGDVVVINPGERVCLDRNEKRATPWLKPIIRKWFNPKPWAPPQSKQSYGEDGWPKDR